MLRKFCYFAVFCLFINSSNALADKNNQKVNTLIKPFTAEYTIIHKSDPVGKGIRQLKQLDNGKFEYSYKTDIEWLIFSDNRKETSTITIDGNKIVPEHYLYNREGTGRDKYYEWNFDINTGKITDVKKNKSYTIEYPANVQDSLSYHLQHRFNMMQNPNQEHYVYPVVKSADRIKNYVYQYEGEEEIMLPYGLVKTIKLKREVVEKKRITYAWFAPELDFLLVKLYQIKGGVEQFEAQLNTVTNH